MRLRKPKRIARATFSGPGWTKFWARLDQIINMKHELIRLAHEIDWGWIDGELAGLFSDKGRPGTEARFIIGLSLLKHIYGLSDEGVCERWVHDPYFQYFTGEDFFQHAPLHEHSGLAEGSLARNSRRAPGCAHTER